MNVQISLGPPVLHDWMVWLENGEKYFRAACPKGSPSRFNPELRYNLLSMSLEGYVMAVCGYLGCLPYNHTYTDLMEALDRVAPLDPELKERILRHESIQEICSIEAYHRSCPDQKALTDLEQAVGRVGEIARQTCIPS